MSHQKERKTLRLSNDNEVPAFEKTFCDSGVQVSLPNPAYEMLSKRIEELENFNQQLLFENTVLKKQLDEPFADQQEQEMLLDKSSGHQKKNIVISRFVISRFRYIQ